MDPDRRIDPATSGSCLLVADWTLDPHAIVTTSGAQGHGVLRLLVPAWLHGLDWAGDPLGSVPCAQRQLEQLADLCAAAGLQVASAEVGDPDPLSAICDALDAGPADEILLFARGRHVARHLLSLASRAERLTGLPVRGFSAPRAPRTRRRVVLAGAHCDPAARVQVA